MFPIFSHSDPKLLIFFNFLAILRHCCIEYDETLKNEYMYKHNRRVVQHFHTPEDQPLQNFSSTLVHSKTLIAKCEKISRRRANKIHQLSGSFLPWRRTWPRFWGKDPRLESRMKSDTRATRAQIRWTTMAWNSEETIKLGEFTTEFRKGGTRNGHKV